MQSENVIDGVWLGNRLFINDTPSIKYLKPSYSSKNLESYRIKYINDSFSKKCSDNLITNLRTYKNSSQNKFVIIEKNIFKRNFHSLPFSNLK